MNAKEYLSQIKRMETEIENRKRDLDLARHDAMGLKSMDYSTDRVQTSPTGDGRITDAVSKILEIEQEITCLTATLIALRHTITIQIHKLNASDHVEILFKRYVEHKSLQKIAEEMNYSYVWVKKIHGHALVDFEKNILKGTKIS